MYRDRLIEGDDITPEVVDVEPDLFVTARHDHIGAECAPDDVERLAQCGTGVLLVELRPEQRQQRVAAVEPAGGGGSEIGEQCEAPGTRQQALDLASLGVGEVQSPEQPELDHARPLRRWRSSQCHRDR